MPCRFETAHLRQSATLLLAALSFLYLGCDGDSGGAAPTATSIAASPTPTGAPPTPPARAPGAFERTEERANCDDFEVLRQPYFGDLHVHTALSADAHIYGTRVGPTQAYAFARGAEISLSDDDEAQTRRAHIDRSLDFAAVTDHSEFFGEVQLCTTPGSLVYDIEMCRLLRQVEVPDQRVPVTARWLFPAGVANPPRSHAFCNMPGVDCDAAAVSVWQEIQAAAEAAYDRSAACSFTSFVGYEHTASPAGRHLHRNVIFRNHHVPSFAASQLETAGGGIPQGLWSAIEADCLNTGEGCDAVIIPHNSNLSGGQQFVDPADGAEARRRQHLEPLVEVHQQKGNSECRFDRIAGAGAGTEDELCTFEQLLQPHELPGTQPPTIDKYPQRNLVRNALKEGLRQEEQLGANAFKMGLIGSTDTHNGAAGNVDEPTWEGAQGNTDASPERQISDNLRDNPGGLAVAWAEENSRDSIFSALRRRETYATSGTRPLVRFFAGALGDLSCADPAFVDRAYRSGTPMGGDVGTVSGAAPTFAILAFKDPGTATAPGTDLQRAQIVKGWVDGAGETHEKVFDVAGNDDNGAGVDPVTCEPSGHGAAQLCTVWTDPEFDASQRAFYYVRLLENPTCRWSTRVCLQAGIDPFSPDCAAQAANADARFANCCLTRSGDAFLAPTIQERAWTSPIWYRPEAIAALSGNVKFGGGRAKDVLELDLRVGTLPADLNLRDTGLTLKLRDNDEIYRLQVPPGALRETGGTLTLDEQTAQSLGLAAASIELGPGRAMRLRLETDPTDLGRADRIDHFVELSLAAGTYEANYARLWSLDGDALVTD